MASTALTKSILDEQAKGKATVRDQYLTLLKSGGSDYPVTLLKRAGVDLTTSAPFRAAMQDMNDIMTEIESLLPASKK